MKGGADSSAETGDQSGRSRPVGLQFTKIGIEVIQLSWSKGAGADWCLLQQVNPVQIDGYGVFIIWRNGDLAHASAVLYVGRGFLRDEIARCQKDALFHGTPELKITWARVDDARTIDAIAAYLYQHVRPMWGEVVPWTPPLAVNLPAA